MKNFFRHLAVGIAAALLLFAVAAVAAACTEGGEQTQLSFTHASVTVGAGESVTAQVETDAEGQVAFSSGNTAVAIAEAASEKSVRITGVAAGSTAVTAQIGGASATLNVTVTAEQGSVSLRAESWAVSAAPGETETFSVSGVPSSQLPQVSADSEYVTASVSDQTESGAVISFTVSASAPVGGSAAVTVSAGGDEESVKVDFCSKGLIYGDGTIDGRPFISDEYGLLLLGADSTFAGGALAVPDCARYEGYWAPVSHIGTADTLFTLPAGKQITSLDTGDSATTIQHRVFEGMNSIASVHIGSSLLGIGDSAFNMNGHYQADSSAGTLTYDGTIETLTFAEDCVLNTIGNSAFLGNKLTELILPDTVSTIADRAFWHAGCVTLKLPARWQEAGGFTMQFFDNYNLEKLYLPWQCAFSVTGDHYPSDPDDSALATEAGLIKSIFTDMTLVNNKWVKPITVYYSGEKALLDNLISVRGQVSGLIHEWCLEHYLTEGEYVSEIVYDTPWQAEA